MPGISGSRASRSALPTGGYGLLAVVYIALLLTCGISALRKGHWIMFIIGIFIPFFWIIGALIPPANRV